MPKLKLRPQRLWFGYSKPYSGRRHGMANSFLEAMYGSNDEALSWSSTRPSAITQHWKGQRVNGVRYAYETETDPGSLDAGYWNRGELGGAYAYDC